MTLSVRIRLLAVPVLSAVLALLLVAYAVKSGVLSLSWLKANKDALAAIQSIVSILVVGLGGIFAYFRFFRGQTWTTRADVAVDVKTFANPSGGTLHCLTIGISNRGTVPIWEPEPSVVARTHRLDGKSAEIDLPQDRLHARSAGRFGSTVEVIDSTESSDLYCEHTFDEAVWAVTYVVTIVCSTGDAWTKVVTVENPARPRRSRPRAPASTGMPLPRVRKRAGGRTHGPGN